MAAPAIAAGDEQGGAHGTFMGELTAVQHTGPHILFFDDAAGGLCLSNVFLTETDVKHAESADIGLAVGHQHGELLLLKRERQVGLDDIVLDVVGVVLTHQSRGNVDRYDLSRTLVDVFHQCGKSTDERLVQARTEKAVDDESIRGQLRRIEIDIDLREFLYVFGGEQTLLVCLAVFGELVVDIEKENSHLVVLSCQHAGHGEGIASIVPRSGKDDYGCTFGPLIHDGTGEGFGGTFHQVDGFDGFVLDRIFI